MNGEAKISWNECKTLICQEYGLKDFKLKRFNGKEWKKEPVYIQGEFRDSKIQSIRHSK